MVERFLLVVEGIDDQRVIWAILKRHKFEPHFKVEDEGWRSRNDISKRKVNTCPTFLTGCPGCSPEMPGRRRPPRLVSGAFRYLAFNKPYDVLTQFSDGAGRSTLREFVAVPGVYPVGRLDRDSEGLLLLTDDGPLAHSLTDPRFAHPKTYLVQVERIPAPEAIEALRRGVLLKDGPTRPAGVDLLDGPPDLPERPAPIRFRKNVPTAWLRVVLREGRNRQVRRMSAAVGHPTLRLVRVAVGPVALGDLAPGRWRDLTPQELAALPAGGRSRYTGSCGGDRPGPRGEGGSR